MLIIDFCLAFWLESLVFLAGDVQALAENGLWKGFENLLVD